MNRVSRHFMTALFGLAIALTTLAAGAQGSVKYKIGDQIKDFSFKSDQGKIVKLSDYKGKIVVLNFFATW